MSETITLELTPGELGILARNFKYDKKQYDSFSAILSMLHGAAGVGDIARIYELKEKPVMDLVDKIKRLSEESGDKRKMQTFDDLLQNYLHSNRLDKENQLIVDRMFMEFIDDPNNLRLALVSPEEGEAHMEFVHMMKRVRS